MLFNFFIVFGLSVVFEVVYVFNLVLYLICISVEWFEVLGVSWIWFLLLYYIIFFVIFEVYFFVLLMWIFNVLRVNNSCDIFEVEWDVLGMFENVEFWLFGKKFFKECLVFLGVREVEWRVIKVKVSGGEGFENLLEEKVVS